MAQTDFRARSLLQTNTCITLVRETYVKENNSITARDRVCDFGPGSRANLGTDTSNRIFGCANTYTAETTVADCYAVAIPDAGADCTARRAAESNAIAYCVTDRVADTDRETVKFGKLYVAVTHSSVSNRSVYIFDLRFSGGPGEERLHCRRHIGRRCTGARRARRLLRQATIQRCNRIVSRRFCKDPSGRQQRSIRRYAHDRLSK